MGKSLEEAMNKFISPTYGDTRFFEPFDPEYGEGFMLYDEEGNGKLDMISGCGVTNLGHDHPAVTKAFMESSRLLHVSNLYRIKAQIRYAENLAKRFPLKDANFFFCNSGAEANAAAEKAASKDNGTWMAAIKDSFHGRYGDGNATTMQVAYNSTRDTKQRWKTTYPCVIELERNNITDLEEKITEDCFSLIYEVVQIEGGIYRLDGKYMKAMRKVCDDNGVIMIEDGVQENFFRTGKLFAAEHHPEALPDMITMAKGIANGYPMGAVGFGEKGKKFIAGEHASTFGGNPPACRIASAVLDTMVQMKDEITANAKTIERDFYRRKLDSDLVVEKRGLGFIYGIQIRDDVPVKDVVDKCREKDVVVGSAEHNTLRLEPAVIIEPELFRHGLDVVAEVLAEIKT